MDDAVLSHCAEGTVHGWRLYMDQHAPHSFVLFFYCLACLDELWSFSIWKIRLERQEEDTHYIATIYCSPSIIAVVVLISYILFHRERIPYTYLPALSPCLSWYLVYKIAIAMYIVCPCLLLAAGSTYIIFIASCRCCKSVYYFSYYAMCTTYIKQHARTAS